MTNIYTEILAGVLSEDLLAKSLYVITQVCGTFQSESNILCLRKPATRHKVIVDKF